MDYLIIYELCSGFGLAAYDAVVQEEEGMDYRWSLRDSQNFDIHHIRCRSALAQVSELYYEGINILWIVSIMLMIVEEVGSTEFADQACVRLHAMWIEVK